MKKLIFLLALCAASAHAVDNTGTVLKPDSISAEPYSDAQSTAKLDRGEKVEILDRKGGWIKVKARQVTGWIRFLSVKRGEASKSSGDAGGVLSLASGRAGTGQVTATAGIRGLNEEELKAAKFNEEEYKKLESFSVSKEAAQQFAATAALQPRALEYLASPASPASNNQQQGLTR